MTEQVLEDVPEVLPRVGQEAPGEVSQEVVEAVRVRTPARRRTRLGSDQTRRPREGQPGVMVDPRDFEFDRANVRIVIV